MTAFEGCDKDETVEHDPVRVRVRVRVRVIGGCEKEIIEFLGVFLGIRHLHVMARLGNLTVLGVLLGRSVGPSLGLWLGLSLGLSLGMSLGLWLGYTLGYTLGNR